MQTESHIEMIREKQLEYCKKCTKQKFDPQQGIICGITNQKANFEVECKDFEIDQSKIEEIKEKQQNKKKSKVAYGFSPKQIDDISVPSLTQKEAFIFAYETAKKLNWNIGFISESGFIAYTKFSMNSWSEEVRIKIQVGNINIKSECAGSQFIDWGKNRNNIDDFISGISEIQAANNEINIEEKFKELSNEFVAKEDNIINSPLSKKEEISGIFSLFKPTKGYFITPILINLNILVFVAMAISGVSIMQPDNESLLLWGANFRPETIDGEWWRLLSSCFLHIGIFHLLMNMYALIYIGLLLEPYLGKYRFLSAYILSGIAASTVSLYWNDLTISAGASGAIFGLYGVFLAMLTTNLIEKSARKALLTSIAVFVGYNLLNGLKGGIDNAAHIGGLLSGLIIGYSFYPSLMKPNLPKIKSVTIALLTVMILGFSFVILNTTTSDIGKYDAEMEKFVSMEEKALSIYNMPENTSDEKYLSAIQDRGIHNWNKSIELLDSVDKFDLPDEIHIRNSKLREYCKLRIESYTTIYNAISEGTDKYDTDIEKYNIQIETIINELSGQ